MKREFGVQTKDLAELIDITAEVQEHLKASKIKDGICVIYIPHTTASVCINENADPSVKSDINDTLDKLIPRDGSYSHSEGNADAHVKASIIGSSRVVLIESGKLLLGTWQGIYFCEFDGPRKRKVVLKFLGS
ncbi:MAG: YjbQ family protein [Candidatus Omnitrophica bacterium]|nr:YjbQ family protein [Candidatus Omnitrophota bacterium]